MSRRVQIRGRINEMALPTVRDLIGLTAWQRITELDAQPTFVEMVIAHEGVSRGEIVGWGARLKEWGRRVIRAVVNAFAPSGRFPVRIYDGLEHWHENQAERVPVGEVIHSFGEQVSGLEQARIIGWIYPRYKVIVTERDCCSMEIDGLVVDINGHSVVEEIFAAVAVVLGHTSKQTPGFAGACVQAITEFGPIEAAGGGASDPAPAPAQSSAPAAPTVPLPAPIPAPPAQSNQQAQAAEPDLTSPAWNPFLPE